jgi:hypothetical protein
MHQRRRKAPRRTLSCSVWNITALEITVAKPIGRRRVCWDFYRSRAVLLWAPKNPEVCSVPAGSQKHGVLVASADCLRRAAVDAQSGYARRAGMFLVFFQDEVTESGRVVLRATRLGTFAIVAFEGVPVGRQDQRGRGFKTDSHQNVVNGAKRPEVACRVRHNAEILRV